MTKRQKATLLTILCALMFQPLCFAGFSGYVSGRFNNSGTSARITAMQNNYRNSGTSSRITALQNQIRSSNAYSNTSALPNTNFNRPGNYPSPNRSDIIENQLQITGAQNCQASNDDGPLSLIANPGQTLSVKNFKNFIINSFGFTDAAREVLRDIDFEVTNSSNFYDGGGCWCPCGNKVQLNSGQYEAALHELSHVWWDAEIKNNYELRQEFVSAMIRLASMDPEENPQYAPAIHEAHTYVYGPWREFDQHDAEYWDSFEQNDSYESEMFASLSSFTMGQYTTGPRQLPEFMWKFFSPLFTGEISETPYYEGGVRGCEVETGILYGAESKVEILKIGPPKAMGGPDE